MQERAPSNEEPTRDSGKRRKGDGQPQSHSNDGLQSRLIRSAPLITLGFLRGVIDSSNFVAFASYLVRSPLIAKLFAECFVVNCIQFLGLLTLNWLMWFVQPSGLIGWLWEVVFSVSWVIPMYIVTQLLGLNWYSEMYKESSRLKKATQRSVAPSTTRPMSFRDASEAILKAVATLLFALAGTLLVSVPYLKQVLWIPSYAMSAWLHAFYCFDYRFADQGVKDSRGKFIPLPLGVITKCFDLSWSYYLGFGSTMVLYRFLLESYGFSLFAVMAFYSALFPIHVVMTVDSVPGPEVPLIRIPVFTWLFSTLTRYLSRSRLANRRPARRDPDAQPAQGGSADVQADGSESELPASNEKDD